MLKIENLNFAFKDRQLFKDFNFHLKKGNKAAIYGKSGSGKSTLLNIIMGFQRPDSGNICISGYNLIDKNIEAVRSKIAWLPQNFHSFGRGIVVDYFKWIFQFKKNNNVYDEHILAKYMDKLSLSSELKYADFNSLSGGEKQRLGIVLCKMLNKEIMLLDEPSSALDKGSINALIDFIFNDKDLTVLVSTHEESLMDFCNITRKI